jgi:hypothetical protein
LFVTDGVQTDFPVEQSTEPIVEMVVPDIPDSKNIVVDDVVADILGCSTPESTPDLSLYLLITCTTLCALSSSSPS